jgi:Tol biopolymer transport system component
LSQDIAFFRPTGSARFTVAPDGPLAYIAGAMTPSAQLGWYSRSGSPTGAINAVGQNLTFALSPDERWVAFNRAELIESGPTSNLWLLDLARGTSSRFTFGSSYSQAPVWSPEGAQITFNRFKKSASFSDGVYIKSVSGVEDEKRLLEGLVFPCSWSPDGQFIVYQAHDPKGNDDFWVLPLRGDRKPKLIAGTEFREQEGQFSRDGRLLAYASNETGRFEVYVRSFPDLRGKWQISTSGGTFPRWRGDGRELFYIDNDQKLMAVKSA